MPTEKSRFAARILIALMTPALCLAQFSSNVQGVVQDPSRAVIPGATVKIRNTETGVMLSGKSSGAGVYRFSSLAPGPYELTVSADGFRTVAARVELRTAQTAEVNVVLPLLAASEQVQVTAEPPALDPADVRIQTTIQSEKLTDLPLVGRNFMMLAAVAPGVTGRGAQVGGSSGNTQDNFALEKFVEASGNGRNYSGNQYTVDGLNVSSNIVQGVTNLSPNPDSVDEVAVQTNSFTVEQGKASSVQVAVTTKSGTNQYHGAGSYLFNNQDMQARTIFTDKYAPFRKHMVAGALGGPVVKNKTFFFSSAETIRSLSSTLPAVNTVESPQFLAWAKANFPNSLGTKLLSSYPADRVAVTGVARLARDVVGNECAAVGLPCDMPMLLNGLYGPSSFYDGLQYNFRGDQYLREAKDRLYLNYYRTNLDRGDPSQRPALDATRVLGSAALQSNWTRTFSPSLLNEVSFGFVRIDGNIGVGNLPFRIPNVSVTGTTGISVPGPYTYIQHNYNWRNVATWNRGAHTWKFGFEAWKGDSVGLFAGTGARPAVSFLNLLDLVRDRPYSQGGVYYDILTGKPGRYEWTYRMNTFGLFVQDEWKVSPTWSLTYGIRWDDFGNPTPDGTSVMANIFPAAGSNVDTRFAEASVRRVEGLYAGRLNRNFSPRFGVAWQPGGQGKWVVRGGVGLYQDWIPLGETDRVRGNPPALSQATFTQFTDIKPIFSIGTSDEYPYGFAVPVMPARQLDARGGVPGAQVAVGGIDRDIHASRSLTYMAGVERELPGRLVAGVNYSGSRTWGSVIGTDFNRFAGDLLDGRQNRLNPSFGSMHWEFNGNDIRYNAMILTLRQSRGANATWQASYTLSRVTDYGQGGSRVNRDSGFNFPDQHAIERYKADSDWDARHRVSLSGVYRLPAPGGLPIWARAFAGGWELSAVGMIQSGMPYTVLNNGPFNPIRDASGKVTGYRPGSGDYNADGLNYDFPNMPSRDFTGGFSRQQYLAGLFAVTDFPAPEPGTPGSMKRHLYRNPGFINIDSAVIKNNRMPWLGERGNLQLRFEFFNVLNRVNLGNVNANLASPTFGRVLSTFNPRMIQLGARMTF